MAIMKRIGIDVGGTNTDAVLFENERVVAAVKTVTTDDVTTGIVNSLNALIHKTEGRIAPLDAVMIGTTHFTNAVVQRRRRCAWASQRVPRCNRLSIGPTTSRHV
jgi:N-methylhydantoinase A/oxoprolinase/acetone carboxylase beta subunit